VILTKDDKMVLTPTYHVFRMFRVHQDARLIPVNLKCEDYVYDGKKIPSISASASVDQSGKMHVSLANLNPGKKISVNIPVIGESFKNIKGEVLTAPRINSYNSFESPDEVKPVAFGGFDFKNNILTVEMPAKSVVVLELSK
jgi:alpha-N-arabinofuranosidase